MYSIEILVAILCGGWTCWFELESCRSMSIRSLLVELDLLHSGFGVVRFVPFISSKNESGKQGTGT